jgi:hypothetical protein
LIKFPKVRRIPVQLGRRVSVMYCNLEIDVEETILGMVRQQSNLKSRENVSKLKLGNQARK